MVGFFKVQQVTKFYRTTQNSDLHMQIYHCKNLHLHSSAEIRKKIWKILCKNIKLIKNANFAAHAELCKKNQNCAEICPWICTTMWNSASHLYVQIFHCRNLHPQVGINAKPLIWVFGRRCLRSSVAQSYVAVAVLGASSLSALAPGHP